MRDTLIHFLDRIKDYEHESGHSMHEDERESSEIVDIHLEALPELKNYVFISNVSGIFEKLAFEAAFPDEDFDWDNYYDWVSENPKKAYDILALWVRNNYR